MTYYVIRGASGKRALLSLLAKGWQTWTIQGQCTKGFVIVIYEKGIY